MKTVRWHTAIPPVLHPKDAYEILQEDGTWRVASLDEVRAIEEPVYYLG